MLTVIPQKNSFRECLGKKIKLAEKPRGKHSCNTSAIRYCERIDRLNCKLKQSRTKNSLSHK